MRSVALVLLSYAPVWAQHVVSGTVVSASTNTPLSKVLVHLAPTGQRLNPLRTDDPIAITSGDGRFTFQNVPAGKYQLTAARTNDSPQRFLADGQYSTAIVTGGAADTTNLVFPYHMPGTISGTVVDEQGDGVRQASVHLFRQEVTNGRSRITNAGQQGTRAGGVFHFGHLPAGTYFVAVTGRPWYAQFPRWFRQVDGKPPERGETTSPEFDVVYPLTYYPGVTEFSSASPVTVTEGNSTSVQIVMRAVPAIHPKMAGPEGRGVRVAPLGPDGQPVSGGDMWGRGVELSVAPGRYRVLSSTLEGRRLNNDEGKVMDLSGDTPLDLSESAKISVSGTVAIEGSTRPTNRMMVVLGSAGRAARAEVGENGTFDFSQQNLSAGRYNVALPNNPAFYLKSVQVKGAKYAGGELELTDNATVQLALVIAPNAAALKLEGTAVREGRPVPGAMVLLIPVGEGREHLLRRDQSDLDGTFTLPSVAPGEYRILAIDDGRDLQYRDPNVLKPYLAGAKLLAVDAAAPGDLTVEAQPRRR